MILRFINLQGAIGLGVAVLLCVALLVQKSETRHWRKQSSQFEQLYQREQAAFAGTIANYRAAAEQARAADRAAAERVAAEQRAINERTADDYEARLAAARARAADNAAERLRLQAQGAAADSRGGGAKAMSAIPASSGRAPQAAGEDRLPGSERLLATEQAIQLDELIKWVRRQAGVDPQGSR